MRRLCMLLLVVMPTTVWALDPVPPNYRMPTLRPTAEDVRYEVLDTGAPFRWCPVRGTFIPATHTCMDLMTETSLLYMTGSVKLLREIGGHTNTTDFCLSDSQGASAIWGLLNPGYEGNFWSYRGTWAEDEDGSDYSKPFYCARKARKFCLYNPVACATAARLHDYAKFLPWLGLRVDGTKVVDNFREPVFPTSKLDKRYAMLGTIDYDHPQPPLTQQQLVLLHATHEAHKAVVAWRCGRGPKPEDGIVLRAHLALEDAARNEAELSFFEIVFWGDVDPRWSPAEVCAIAELEDYDHGQWMAGVAAGSWAQTRKAKNNHNGDHACMNLRDPRLKIARTDCPGGRCTMMTCAQLIAMKGAIIR